MLRQKAGDSRRFERPGIDHLDAGMFRSGPLHGLGYLALGMLAAASHHRREDDDALRAGFDGPGDGLVDIRGAELVEADDHLEAALAVQRPGQF